MRKTLITGLSAVALASFFATPASAADVGGGFSVSGSAALVSDYRFRGISQTDKDFAIQGGITVSHESGLYVGTWGSSIDDYIAGGSDQEIDLIAGFKKDFSGTTLDVGFIYYYYPGGEKIIPGLDTDFFEPYIAVSRTFGPVTGKVSAAYAPKQSALSVGNGKEDNLYIAADLSAGIPSTPLSISGHIGHSFGPSYLTIGKEYTDWNVGVSYTKGPITVGALYVDTNKNAYSPSGKNISKAGVVGTLSVAF